MMRKVAVVHESVFLLSCSIQGIPWKTLILMGAFLKDLDPHMCLLDRLGSSHVPSCGTAWSLRGHDDGDN